MKDLGAVNGVKQNDDMSQAQSVHGQRQSQVMLGSLITNSLRREKQEEVSKGISWNDPIAESWKITKHDWNDGTHTPILRQLFFKRIQK